MILVFDSNELLNGLLMSDFSDLFLDEPSNDLQPMQNIQHAIF